jgi:hypothetical protein
VWSAELAERAIPQDQGLRRRWIKIEEGRPTLTPGGCKGRPSPYCFDTAKFTWVLL